ncbi:MAG: tetratricopeptide repeat protein [Deltaproteobacteria bacterium]|nr:tetratricopeptide repeat protein [Deltaproteobacteria bacterium]
MTRFHRGVCAVAFVGLTACGGGAAETRKDTPPKQEAPPPKPAEPAPDEAPKPEETQDLSQGMKKPPPTKNPEAIAAFADASKAWKAWEGKGPQPAELAEHYQRAANADPKMAVALYNLGALAEQRGALDEAEQHYRKAISMDPTLEYAVANLGALLERKGSPQEQVRKLYQAVVDKNPRAVAARLRLAEMELTKGDPAAAQRLTREALAHEPRSLPAYRLLARSYLAQRHTSLAKLMALRGLKIRADDADMTFIMGEILLAEKDQAAGLTTLRRAVELDGSQLKARFQLAMFAMEARDFNGAAEQYEEILRRDPKNLTALHNLGLALQGQGKFGPAREALLNAARIHPEAPEPHYALADLYMRNMNQYADAKVELNTFVKMKGPSMPARHPALSMLTQVDQLIRQEAENQRQLELLKKQEEEEAKKAAEEDARIKAEEEALAKAEEEARLKAEEAARNPAPPAPADGGAPQPPPEPPPADATPTPPK